MNGSTKRNALLALVLAPGLAQTVAAAAETTVTYPRRSARAADLRRAPEIAAPPRALRPSAAEHATPRAGRMPGHPGTPPVEVAPAVAPERRPTILAAARSAAAWSAAQQLAMHGALDYYRVGLHAGLRAAMLDPGLGHGEFSGGRLDGWDDPQARELGLAIGRADAGEAARAAAERQVDAQFRDLDRVPRFAPRIDRPAYAPRAPELAAPGLREVFEEFPLRELVPLRGAFARALRDWQYDAFALYRCEDFSEFFPGRWPDAESALRDWAADDLRSAALRSLRVEPERALFRAAFAAELERRLARAFTVELRPAYERGFGDGWSYGAFVHEEWDYRRGYVDGFRQALADSAVEAFAGSYAALFTRAYGTAFDGWSNSSRPEIGAAALRDADDDGIFEPGERVYLELEAINFGGREGRFEVRLEGAALADPGRTTIVLPARGRRREVDLLEARISELARARTSAELLVSLADQRRTLALRVARPLELVPQALRIDRDNLGGTVRIEIAVQNVSRLPRPATLMLSTPLRPGADVASEIGELPPGSRRSATFTLDGLRSLDLIAGAVRLDLALASVGTGQDALSWQVPETATDLSSRDLVDLLLRMSRDTATSVRDREFARELLLLRLRADWSAAVRAAGNPYKSDFRTNGTDTALGELVQAWRRGRRSLESAAAFDGLGADVAAFAADLPGPHPFLRKYVRRLAGRLP